MTADTMTMTGTEVTIYPRWLRVCHWINALAVLVMIGSGWQIYNASPLFDFLTFPRQIALGNWLAGALLWHFAAMWLLVINGIVYVTLGIVTGRFRRKLLPIRPAEVIADVKAALTFKLAHDDLTHYNAVQKLLYAGVIAAGIVIVGVGSGIGSSAASDATRDRNGSHAPGMSEHPAASRWPPWRWRGPTCRHIGRERRRPPGGRCGRSLIGAVGPPIQFLRRAYAA